MDNKSFVLLMVFVWGTFNAILHPIDTTKQLIALIKERKAKKKKDTESK